MQQFAEPNAASSLADELLALTAQMRERHDEDPFGNPVLTVALAISRRIDRGEVSDADIEALVRHLRDTAFADRAAADRRLCRRHRSAAATADALATLAARLVRPDPADSPVPLATFRGLVERPRFAAVFTAHPTFSLPEPVAAALADAASERPAPHSFVTHRSGGITLEEEFAQSVAAILHGRDALDRLTEAVLGAARDTWPGRWTEMVPRAGDPGELGRLRHRRAHRHRLVGHAAPAAAHEAPATASGAGPGRGRAGRRGGRRTRRRGRRGGRSRPGGLPH